MSGFFYFMTNIIVIKRFLYDHVTFALFCLHFRFYSLASIPGLAKQMIGYKLSTKQTTGDGVTVNRVMVAESLDIARETYFAIVMDRIFQGPVLVGSPEGGMDIEEVAAKTPDKIFKVCLLSYII